MNIQTTRHPKKRLIFIALVGLILVCTGLVAWSAAQSKNNSSTTSAPAKQTSKAESNSNDSRVGAKTDETSSPKQPQAYDNSQSKANLPITITALDASDEQVTIRTLIDQVSNEGTCTLTLESADKSIIRHVGIQALANSSTCQGFSIPKSDLGHSSIWKVTISATIGTTHGTATKTLNLDETL